MAVIKISELPEAMTMADDDVLAIVKGAATQKIQRENLFFSPENIVYVAKNGNDANDGSQSKPFLTITAANEYAVAHMPSYPNRVKISIAPGLYQDEHIGVAHYRCHITGEVDNLDHRERSVILANLGTEPANYSLGVGQGLNLNNITIATMNTEYNSYVPGIFGALSHTTQFSNCTFKGGYFVEQELVDITGVYINFDECFFDCDGFKLAAVERNSSRFIALRNCDLSGGLPTFESYGTEGMTVKISENSLMGDNLLVAGNWSFLMQNSEMYNDGKVTFDTDGFIDVSNSIIVNELHFIKDTLAFKKFVNNYYRDITPGQTDITVEAGITISIVEYSGNKQENGLPAAFQIAGGGRNVGGFAENRYSSLQCAISSIPAGESGIIEIHANQADLAEFILNAGSNVTIKCGKKYNLAFTGDVVTLGVNQSLSFHEVAFLDGGKLEINGDSAMLAFEGCLTIQGYIVSTAGVGSMVFSYFSSLVSVTGHPVLQVGNVDTLHVSGYSRWKGAAGQPAIIFNVLTENKLKGKFTTFLHGDFGGNAPFTYAGSGKVEFAIYNSAFNAALSAATFTNIIGSPNNSVSPEINF